MNKNWAFKIHVTSDHINQLDVMIIGKAFYGHVPTFLANRIECLYWSGGLWKGNIFDGDKLRRFVFKWKR